MDAKTGRPLKTTNKDLADAAPSAKFLQARISTLTTTLIRRFENILAVAVSNDDFQGNTESNPPPSLIDTAVQQFQLDTEAQSLIRACEDIMMLTRHMKELWLFGGLDTLAEDHDKEKNAENTTGSDRTGDDVKIVEEGFRRFLDKYETTFNLSEKDEQG